MVLVDSGGFFRFLRILEILEDFETLEDSGGFWKFLRILEILVDC